MNTTIRFSAIAAAAALAWGLWCASITWFHGWDGLDWLQGFHWGAIPVCIAVAAACAVAVARNYEPARLSLFVILASVLCFAAFAAGRDELYQMFGGMDFVAFAGRPLRRVLYAAAPPLRLALYAIAVSVSLPWLASRLLAPLHGWTALLAMVALVLAVLLAAVTVTCFPGERHADLYNAIRLGYPVFWIALLLPAALWGGVRR